MDRLIEIISIVATGFLLGAFVRARAKCRRQQKANRELVKWIIAMTPKAAISHGCLSLMERVRVNVASGQARGRMIATPAPINRRLLERLCDQGHIEAAPDEEGFARLVCDDGRVGCYMSDAIMVGLAEAVAAQDELAASSVPAKARLMSTKDWADKYRQ